jgi:hypothetical protein
MANTEIFFSVTMNDATQYDGRKQLASSETTVYNGFLAGFATGSVIVSTGSPVGMFYDFMAMVEKPATKNLGTYLGDKYVNIVRGAFTADVGKDLFSAGALPAQDAKLYDDGHGKLAVAGSGVIGRVEQHVVVNNIVSGAQTVARCYFDFTAVLS